MRAMTQGAVALLLAGAAPAMAAPRLGGILADHAVVQRGQPIAVTGDAAPGEAVTAIIDHRAASARADRDGRFCVTVPALPAGGPYDLLVTAASGATVLHDILVCDVFQCSGQSNMEMPVGRRQGSFGAFEVALP